MTPPVGTSESGQRVHPGSDRVSSSSVSRTLVYIFSTVAGVFSIEYVVFPLLGMGGVLNWLPSLPLLLIRESAYALLAVRGVLWFIRRRIAPPASFSGIPYGIACISLVVQALAIGFYLLVFSLGSTGVSGIPLAFVVFPIGIGLAIITPIVEVADWMAFHKERRRAAQANLTGIPHDGSKR